MKIKPKILLVDDDPRFIESLESVLYCYDYSCTKAFTGAESQALLQRQSFDLALLDIELPDMSGCEIAKFIKSSCIQTTAIMLTGMKTVENAVRAMKMGAYDFLTKPLNHEMLLKTLQNGLEHNRLKAELKSSEQKFQMLAEAAWEGIVVHENGNIVAANRPFLKMFGISENDLKHGLSIDVLLGKAVMPWLRDGVPHGDVIPRVMIGCRKDGGEVPVEVICRPSSQIDKSSDILVVRDITERLKAENENISLHKKLAEAHKLETLGVVAGSVAHDLNNILTGVVSYPELLLMQMDPTHTHYEPVKKIQLAGKRAATVVSDLLTIARVRTKQKATHNLNDLIMNYLNSREHSELLTKHQEGFVLTNLSSEECIISCSPPHIYKVLSGLICNAFEDVLENGRVCISTEKCVFTHPLRSGEERPVTDYTKLVIAGNGSGIEEKHIDHLFNPYYSTKVMGRGGTGLELSVVWNIVQDHEGWIEVIGNAPGAVFEIYFPEYTLTSV